MKAHPKVGGSFLPPQGRKRGFSEKPRLTSVTRRAKVPPRFMDSSYEGCTGQSNKNQPQGSFFKNRHPSTNGKM